MINPIIPKTISPPIIPINTITEEREDFLETIHILKILSTQDINNAPYNNKPIPAAAFPDIKR